MGKFFINRPIFAICMAIGTVLLGLISISNLAIEQYPDITPPVVEVTATYYGADANLVNNTVATPIAEQVMGVSDMLYMQTTSANDGTMTLQVLFEIGSDPDIDAILTQNKVSAASATLPESVIEQGVITQKVTPEFLMVYALSSEGSYSGSFLTNYAYINLQNQLLKISGVSQVQIMGAGEYAMRVWLDPQKLAYYNISVAEITEQIIAQGDIYPAGKLGAQPTSTPTPYTYTLTLPAQISTPEQYENIIIRSSSEHGTVFLSDLARVDLGTEDYDVLSQISGAHPATLILVYQSPGSNAIDVANQVKQSITKLSKKLPEGVECQVIVDTTSSVKAGIKDIFKTLLIALLLVIFIIYLFLQNWRATLIPLIAIPVSLIGAFILFPALGFSINIISLLGLVLAIGLVVDDAIVVVEAVEVNIANGMDSKKASREALRNVSSPIIATTLVLLAVFVPVCFLGGVVGKLYQQFASIISLSVLISAINALTLSPALSSILLTKRTGKVNWFFERFNKFFDNFMSRYLRSLGVISRHALRTFVFVAVMLACIVILWRKVPIGFLPDEDQGYLMVMVETPPNTSLWATNQSMQKIDALVSSLDEVTLTCYASGYDMLAGVSSSNNGIIFVKLVDYSERKLTSAQIADKLNEILYGEIADAECYAFIPPSIPGLGLISGVTFVVQDLEGKGEDYLYANTEKLIDTLKKNPLISNVTTQYTHGVPQRELEIDRAQAMMLGVNLESLYEMLGAMFGGSYINNFNRFGREYQTYIQAEASFRRDETSLEDYYIENSSGEQIPLSAFVSIKESLGVGYVSQFNLYESIALTVNLAKGASTDQVMKLITKLDDDYLPEDIGTAWNGVSFQQSESSKDGNLIYVFILIFVFLVLAALYDSWGLPLSILLAIPIAVFGALIFIFIAHLFNTLYVNDVYLQISLIMLIGLSAKNAILVVEYANRMFFEQNLTLKDSVYNAAKLRVRPILMTAFAFILGVLPLVFASGVYAVARNIIGIALVGGMGIATMLGIYLYPTLYYVIAKLLNFEKLREKRRAEECKK